MSTRRLVDLALVALAALLLAAGTAYWVAGAPEPVGTPEFGAAEPAALSQLQQRVADEMTVSSESFLSHVGPLEAGETLRYPLELTADMPIMVEVVCAGSGEVIVALPSETGPVPCGPDPAARAYSLTGQVGHDFTIVNRGQAPVVIGVGVRPE